MPRKIIIEIDSNVDAIIISTAFDNLKKLAQIQATETDHVPLVNPSLVEERCKNFYDQVIRQVSNGKS